MAYSGVGRDKIIDDANDGRLQSAVMNIMLYKCRGSESVHNDSLLLAQVCQT